MTVPQELSMIDTQIERLQAERNALFESENGDSMSNSTKADTGIAELAAYRATGMTPDDVAQFVSEQRAICVKCTGNAEGLFLDQIGEPWDCKMSHCKSHMWRKAWYKI